MTRSHLPVASLIALLAAAPALADTADGARYYASPTVTCSAPVARMDMRLTPGADPAVLILWQNERGGSRARNGRCPRPCWRASRSICPGCRSFPMPG